MEPEAPGLPSVKPDLGLGVSTLGKLRGDYARYLAIQRGPRVSPGHYIAVLTRVDFWAVVLFRLAAAARRNGLGPVARVLSVINIVCFGADLHPRARVGPGFVVANPVGVSIGAGVRIGRDVVIKTGATLDRAGLTDDRRDGYPTVGDGCRIMEGAKLFGPIEIGHQALIGANALVTSSIPAGAIVESAPARIVRVEAPEDPAPAKQ